MAYAERRGRGPSPWRVKYKTTDGSEASESGFETKKAALAWGNEQETTARRLLRGELPAEVQADPEPDDITVKEWSDRWMASQEVGVSTTNNREYLLRRFILPKFETRLLRSLTTEEINAWERALPAAAATTPGASSAPPATATTCPRPTTPASSSSPT